VLSSRYFVTKDTFSGASLVVKCASFTSVLIDQTQPTTYQLPEFIADQQWIIQVQVVSHNNCDTSISESSG
jgi:hypothetical protein